MIDFTVDPRDVPDNHLDAPISAALASGRRRGRAIGQRVGEHRAELAGGLGSTGRPLPSEAMLRRAVPTVGPGW